MLNALRTCHVIRPNLFQLLEYGRADSCPNMFATMSARKRRLEATETPSSSARKLARPPENTCKYYVQAVSHAFDPKRVLFRRLCYINEDRTKYVSVGFFPTRHSQPFVEFGVARKNGSNFIILNDMQIDTITEYVPRMCESMFNNENAGLQ